MRDSRVSLSRQDVGDDEPLRLKVAAALAFPDGSMTASGLRREASKGNLALERIAHKDYTTLRAISEMRKKCRVEAKVQDSGSTCPKRREGERHRTGRLGHPRRLNKAQHWMRLGEIDQATKALRDYLNAKPTKRARDCDPSYVSIADVVAIYAEDVVSKHARPKETAARLERILNHFGDKCLSYLNKKTCAEYVKKRGSEAAARRELEDLRSAVRHHWEAGLCVSLTPVVLPERGAARERWLTRQEAAHFLRTARRMRQFQFGKQTDRATAYHVAQFFLVGLYTGTRAGAICGAALDQPTIGRSGSISKTASSIGRRLGNANRRTSNRRRLSCRRGCWPIFGAGSARAYRSARWSSGTASP